MSNEEIAKALRDFGDYLNVSNMLTDIVRWLGWVFVKGLVFLVNELEKVTDNVLLIKTFFQNEEIISFIQTIRPFLYILLAFSLLYVGYMLIFQKKFDREGIAINLFIALIVIALLGEGMDKSSEFTDEAIDAIGKDPIYGESSIGNTIIKKNVTDLLMFDKNNWTTSDLDTPNDFPTDKAGDISIKQRFTKDAMDSMDISMSANGKEIAKHFLVLGEGGADKIAKFDQSGLEFNNEYYFRYDVNWLTLLTTLCVIGFTLFSIAYKLARLSFELAFNYVLAIIIAPADVHDGQKTKKIIQSIFNTFLVIILIFLSMKIYITGTAYIAEELTGLAYLIALIAFSVAVIDGPNIVERLFGIDAGLKSGWGVLAGAYAGGRALSGLANMSKNGSVSKGSDSKNKSLSAMSGGATGEKAPSPNDAENGLNKDSEKDKKNKGKNGSGGITDGKDGLNENKAPSPNDTEKDLSDEIKNGSSAVSTVSQQADEQSSGQRKQVKAPSPNDGERANGSLNNTESISSIADQTQGVSPTNNINTGGVSSPSSSPTNVQGGTGNVPTTNGSHSVEKSQGVQQSTSQTDSDITSVTDQMQGNSSVNNINTGGASSPSSNPANVQSNTGNVPTSNGSHSVEKLQGVQNSTVQTDTEISNAVENVQGNTTVNNASNPSASSSVSTSSPTPNISNGSSGNKNVNGSHTTETEKITSNSTVTRDTEVTNSVEQIDGGSTVINSNTGASNNSNPVTRNENTRLRPRSYKVNNDTQSVTDRIKNGRRK